MTGWEWWNDRRTARSTWHRSTYSSSLARRRLCSEERIVRTRYSACVTAPWITPTYIVPTSQRTAPCAGALHNTHTPLTWSYQPPKPLEHYEIARWMLEPAGVIIIIIIIIIRTVFTMLSPGIFMTVERSQAVANPQTDWGRLYAAIDYTHHRYFITTQRESRYSFYSRNANKRPSRPGHCRKGVQLVPRSLYHFMRPDSLLRLWRYINHLLTYLLKADDSVTERLGIKTKR